MQKFKFTLCFALVIVAFCVFSGCSHNATFAASGKVFCLNETGLTYVNGRMIFDSSRENSHLRAEFSDADSVAQAAGGNLNSLASVEKITGKQVTGYLAEVNESNPDAVKKYMSDCPMAERDAMSVSPVTPLEPKQAPAASGQQAQSGQKECTGDDCESEPPRASEIIDGIKDAAGSIISGSGTSAETVNVMTQPCWKKTPLGAKQESLADGKLLLVMYARSTCSNCAKTFNALQTDEFASFVEDNDIVCLKYYNDSWREEYDFTKDYAVDSLPSFLLLKPTESCDPLTISFSPDEYSCLGIFPTRAGDDAKNLMEDITKALDK